MDDAIGQGCSVHFAAGVHTVTNRLGYTLSGTEADPVVIRGDGSDTTKILRPDAAQNLLDLQGEHFVLRDLELEGGSRGVRLEGDTAHARFENLVVYGTADAAFTANQTGATFTDLTIRSCELYDTRGLGECLYLGCHNGACDFGPALVEFNHCHDTQSDQGSGQGDGIDLKGGSFDVIVRHNVIERTAGPGILAYGNGGRGRNIIEGNLIVDSGNVGIQVTSDAIVRNNVVIRSGGDGAGLNGSATNQGIANDVQWLHNTVVMTNPAAGCLEARGWNDGISNMVIANNALFCPGGTALFVPGASFGVIANNAIEGATALDSGTFDGGSYLDALIDAVQGNAYPVPGSVLFGGGTDAHTVDEDFNCLMRDPAQVDVGAYRDAGPTNPGATGGAFKICLGPPTPEDTSDTGSPPAEPGDPRRPSDTASATPPSGCGCGTGQPRVGAVGFLFGLGLLRRRAWGAARGRAR
ncbi:MAG: right-handed parallel beta-helix repeat-containing protein, partial [Myxococcota bacterium]